MLFVIFSQENHLLSLIHMKASLLKNWRIWIIQYTTRMDILDEAEIISSLLVEPLLMSETESDPEELGSYCIVI